MQKKCISICLIFALFIGISIPASTTNIENPRRYNTVSLRAEHGAAISVNGDLYTWGANYSGQLGLGDYATRNTPTKVPGLTNVVSVRVGYGKSAAITSDGTLYIWGNENTVPSKIQGLENVVDICFGELNTALTSDGSVYAWGSNKYYQLGFIPDEYDSYDDSGKTPYISEPTKVPGLTDVVAISLVAGHTAAITADGSLYTWGHNYFGQLGYNSETYFDDPIGQRHFYTATPTKVSMDAEVVSVSVGTYSTAAVTVDGFLYTWGLNTDGQLGHDNAIRSYYDLSYTEIPTRVPGLTDVVDVSFGEYNHCAAITADGSLYTWGIDGALGYDSTEYYSSIWYEYPGGKPTEHQTLYTPTPTKVPGLTNVVAVSLGYDCSTAITANGDLYAWGYDWGRLGIASTPTGGYYRDVIAPVKIMRNVMLPSAELALTPPSFIAPNLDSAKGWATEGITSAVRKGFVPDDIQGDYQSIITRSEFCIMAIKFVEYVTGKSMDAILIENDLSLDPNAFTDTSDPYILAAYALGITGGVGNNRFNPSGQFSRQQAARMVTNLFNAFGMDTSAEPATGLADIGSAANWAVDSINFCYAGGIMRGTGNNMFSPTGLFTRQQSIVMLDRIDYVLISPDINKDYLPNAATVGDIEVAVRVTVSFNTTEDSVFSNTQAREALGHALDYQFMGLFTFDESVSGITLSFDPPIPYDYNPDIAEQYAIDSGLSRERIFIITLYPGEAVPGVAATMAEFVALMLLQIGVDVTIYYCDNDTLNDHINNMTEGDIFITSNIID